MSAQKATAKTFHGSWDLLLTLVELLLLLLGIFLAWAWLHYPNRHFDIYLAISVATLALVDWLRRKFKEEPAKRRQDKGQGVFETRVGDALGELKSLLQARNAAGLADAAAAGPPPPNALSIAAKQFTAIAGYRDHVEGGIKKIAQAQRIQTAGRKPADLLTETRMPDTFKKGIGDYLNATADLVHLDEPMRDWALKSGKTFVSVIDMMVQNAQTQAP